MHTIEQVKVLLAAAECLPDTPINFPDDGSGEQQYRRAIDLLDSLGMVGGAKWIGDQAPFEVINVVEPETGDLICSLYGPVGVRACSPVEALAGKVLQLPPRPVATIAADVACSHPGCRESARRIIAGRAVCADPDHQDAAANGPYLEPVA